MAKSLKTHYGHEVDVGKGQKLSRGHDLSSFGHGVDESKLRKLARDGRVEKMQVLISKGVAIDAPHPRLGYTPLHWASLEGQVGAVRCLIEANAQLNFTDNAGFTALHKAAANGRSEALECLIEANADLDVQTTAGWTALHKAAANGHDHCVQLLKDAGADTRSARC